MAITANDKKISQMTDVAASVGMYVPLIDLTQLPSAQNVRATVTSILSLVPAPSFASITGKPTTLAGYGIVDGITAAAAAAAYQPLDADLTAISALATTAYGRDLLVQVDAAAVRAYIGVGAGSGTVTSVGLVGTANQITVSGASPITTSGSFTLSFPAGGVTLPGTTTGTFSGALTGNASTATALQTARTINGTSFDGTANITVSAAAGTLTGATLAAGVTASSLLSAAGGSFGTAAFTASTDYQPIDADLTAIAALSTTAYGRDFLVQVDAAAARAYIGAGTGGGTVTSFSSGNLSPLFTTSVATATTTPALSFTISTQAANLVFSGPTSGGAVAPTFRSLVAADIPSLSSVYQPLDADLTAIAALATTGYARRTGSDAWTLDTSIPSASLTPPGSTTQVIYNNAGAFGAASTLTYVSSVLRSARNNIQTTPTDGFVLENTTDGTAGITQQYSPSIKWIARGYADSSPQVFDFRSYLKNVTDLGVTWVLEGGDYSLPLTYQSELGLLTAERIEANQSIGAPAIIYAGNQIDVNDGSSNMVFTIGVDGTFNASGDLNLNPQDALGSGLVNINGSLTLTTALDEIYGGTGLTSYTQGDLLYSSSANTLAKLAKNASATRYLSNTGTSNNPAWAQVNLENGVTGTLPVANGGTSFTGYTTGDMLYASAAGTLSKLAEPGLPGYVLSWAGGVPVATQLSTIAVTALSGTANEITASSATGSVTLSLPTALTFTGKTVTGGTFNGGAFNGTLGATTPSTVAATSLTTTTAFDSVSTGAQSMRRDFATDGSTIRDVLYVTRSYSGGAGADGIGGRLRFLNETTTEGLFEAAADIEFQSTTATAGAVTGSFIIRVPSSGVMGAALTLTSTGINSTPVGATTPSTVASTTLQATTSILQGGGMKHQRVSTGSIGAGSTALVTLTWTSAFANANYTAVASVVEATTSSLSLSVVHIESVSASSVAVRIINNAAGSLTGELQVIGLHD